MGVCPGCVMTLLIGTVIWSVILINRCSGRVVWSSSGTDAPPTYCSVWILPRRKGVSMTGKQYKFFNALLALDDRFTADDIVRYTGLTKGTVTTLINRGGAYLEQQGRIETGRPGGQIVQYRVR